MKSKKSPKIALFAILLFSSLVITCSKLSDIIDYDFNNNSQKITGEYNKLKPSIQWTVPYIHINNNWTIANMTYDWCNYKNGHYIIENVSITGGVYAKNGIHIENTTENFIIRNCHIDDGVSLIRVQGGHLINNTLFFGQAYYTGTDIRTGVYMIKCNNITLRDNFLNDTFTDYFAAKYGFLMYDCNNITAADNDFSIFDITGSGDIKYSEGIAVQEFYGSKNIVLINNTIQQFGIGISITPQVTDCKVVENHILNSKFSGIYISGNNHLVSNNSIRNYYDSSSLYSMDRGISVTGSNNSIFWNEIVRAELGIKISHGGYNNVYNNTIQESRDYGIFLEESNYNKMINNLILKSGRYGMYLDSINHSIITGNTISSVYGCITEINCYGNIIEDNICIQIPFIFGYYPILLIGILLISTFLLIKSKRHYKKENEDFK